MKQLQQLGLLCFEGGVDLIDVLAGHMIQGRYANFCLYIRDVSLLDISTVNIGIGVSLEQ